MMKLLRTNIHQFAFSKPYESSSEIIFALEVGDVITLFDEVEWKESSANISKTMRSWLVLFGSTWGWVCAYDSVEPAGFESITELQQNIQNSTFKPRTNDDRKMNKQEILQAIAASVERKHPWRISQDKYFSLFGQLPREFLEERAAYDSLVEKSKNFKLCQLVLSEVKVEVKLNIDELIEWELNLDKWEQAKIHDIRPNDIKKLINKRKEE